MKYAQRMAISAYTAEGGIVMIAIAPGSIERSEEIEPLVAVVDLDADDRVLGIEVLDRDRFDLAVAAAEYGIQDLVPEIESAIAAARPGP